VFARVRVALETPSIEFGITSHLATYEGGTRGYGTFEREVEDPVQADLVCHGWIKWDGCSHLWWPYEGGYAHVCGGSAWDDLLAALSAVRAFASRHMPEEFPPLT
jgi:hypothetical protein